MTDTLQNKNASGLTHYLRELGNGSMKEGIQTLLDESTQNKELMKQLQSCRLAGNVKSAFIVLLLGALAVPKIKKLLERTSKRADEQIAPDLAYAKSAVERMTESEIEAVIEQSLQEKPEAEEYDDRQEDTLNV